METLKKLSVFSENECHIGVFVQGILLLEQARKHPGQAQNNQLAVDTIRSGDFVTNLKCYFSAPDNFPENGRHHTIDAIL